MKRILVATDDSEDALRAIRFAAELARQFDAELIIANVIAGYEFPGEVFQQLAAPQNKWLDEMLAAESTRVLHHAREIARQAGLSESRIESRRGSPAEVILDIAEERSADAIVVGKRGQTRLQGLLLGSVSQKLASLAGQTVIIVP